MLTCILKAVDKHADLLRESAADVGNDHRLGANEAPPAIVSIYLRRAVTGCIITAYLHRRSYTQFKLVLKLETGVKTLPDFMKDATDRNRTSPFAFTGNKFEFRMVGSQDSIASAKRCIEYNRSRSIFMRRVMNWKKQTILIWQYMI